MPDGRTDVAAKVRSESGAALAVVLMAMTLLTALGGAVLTVAITEVRIAAYYRDGLEALHAADAMVERIRSELRKAPDAQAVLSGEFTASFRDAVAGDRRLRDTIINLTELTNIERCNTVRPCSRAALAAVTAERPWGANNPEWRLYSHGWMSTAPGDAGERPVYLVAWVGDDPSEDDGDPRQDGVGPGQGRLAFRVRAYGGHGARRDIDVVMAGIPRNPRLVHWMER